MNMENTKRKVAVIGTGFVGMSFAYAATFEGVCDELVLIDVNREKALGEAMDLNHGLAFCKANMHIYAGDYRDCRDADVAVICAGAAQKPGESRLALLQRNKIIFESIVSALQAADFNGIFLVATNPVDILTRLTGQLSGCPVHKVIGSGTTLDTARLRYLLGAHFKVDPKNVHAYVIGEHGDSELVPWSQAFIGTKPILEIVKEHPEQFRAEDLQSMATDVKEAAYKIIAAKKATYYGIGLSLLRIVKAVLGDENSILTVSTCLSSAYENTEAFAGVPCILGRNGVEGILKLHLTETEEQAFLSCVQNLDSIYSGCI